MRRDSREHAVVPPLVPLALIDGAGGVQRDLANCNGDGTVDVALETAKDEPLTPIVERRLVLFEGTIRIERGGATDTVAIRQVIRKIFVPATRTATA